MYLSLMDPGIEGRDVPVAVDWPCNVYENVSVHANTITLTHQECECIAVCVV